MAATNYFRGGRGVGASAFECYNNYINVGVCIETIICHMNACSLSTLPLLAQFNVLERVGPKLCARLCFFYGLNFICSRAHKLHMYLCIYIYSTNKIPSKCVYYRCASIPIPGARLDGVIPMQFLVKAMACGHAAIANVVTVFASCICARGDFVRWLNEMWPGGGLFVTLNSRNMSAHKVEFYFV